MTIAAVGAVVIGATEEAAARRLPLPCRRAAGRRRRRPGPRFASKALADLVPKTALVERMARRPRSGRRRSTVGDVILVRPGRPHAGRRHDPFGASRRIDESPVTGESVPKR
jgi:Cd2+/Zn2+-exporting ATPase